MSRPHDENGLRGQEPGLRVTFREAGERCCVLSVSGEIDLTTSATLKSELSRLLGLGYRRFVLDLSAVRFMDSTGLSVLIGFQKAIPAEAVLACAAPPPGVVRLLALTGLQSRFELFADVDAALAWARSGAGGS